MLAASAAIALLLASPGDPAALQRAVTAAVAARLPSLAVPPGTYNFSSLPASDPATLSITDAASFALVASGAVELVFPPRGGVRINDSSNVSLSGVTIDAWPPFTTQGLVSHGKRAGKWFNFTLTIQDIYDLDRARFLGSRALFFDAATRRTLPNQVLAVTSALALEPLGGGAWAVAVSFSANPTLTVPDGALCALAPFAGGPALLVANSSRFAASDVTSHGASGFTILEFGGEGGHSYTRLNVTRRPGSGRLLASTAE